MFVLPWRKLWNFQNQDNIYDTRDRDSGVIQEETVEAVIDKAQAMVVKDDAHHVLHSIKTRLSTYSFGAHEYYTYEFDDVIREVVSETPFNEDDIELSPVFVARLAVLRKQSAGADKEYNEQKLAEKREQLARLKAELGES